MELDKGPPDLPERTPSPEPVRPDEEAPTVEAAMKNVFHMEKVMKAGFGESSWISEIQPLLEGKLEVPLEVENLELIAIRKRNACLEVHVVA